MIVRVVVVNVSVVCECSNFRISNDYKARTYNDLSRTLIIIIHL